MKYHGGEFTLFQFTLSWRERHLGVDHGVNGGRISIHALLKRATFILFPPIILHFISIHALLKRATQRQWQHWQQQWISIHALLKRATIKVASFFRLSVDFNSRSPEESDELLQVKFQGGIYFNSRSPEESDKAKLDLEKDDNDFNSRSPEESDNNAL